MAKPKVPREPQSRFGLWPTWQLAPVSPSHKPTCLPTGRFLFYRCVCFSSRTKQAEVQLCMFIFYVVSLWKSRAHLETASRIKATLFLWKTHFPNSEKKGGEKNCKKKSLYESLFYFVSLWEARIHVNRFKYMYSAEHWWTITTFDRFNETGKHKNKSILWEQHNNTCSIDRDGAILQNLATDAVLSIQ